MSNMVSFDRIWDPSNYGGVLIRRAPLLGRIRYISMHLILWMRCEPRRPVLHFLNKIYYCFSIINLFSYVASLVTYQELYLSPHIPSGILCHPHNYHPCNIVRHEYCLATPSYKHNMGMRHSADRLQNNT